MADREFTNINGIKVCDQTARNSIPTKTSQLENDSNFVTDSVVDEKIANAQLGSGGEVDLSSYARITDLPTKTSQLTNDSGYITNIPDEYITETELNNKGYATTSQIPTVPTNVSSFTNDANYASETYVTNKIAEAQLGGGSGTVDLSGYVTKETGNANQITFADGQTFQAKLDAGRLKGDKGDKGETGAQGPAGADGLTTSINVNGNTYTHVDGLITLPNYPTVVDAYTKSETDNLIQDYTGGKKQVYLTQAEYDILTDIEKNDETKVYNITDTEEVYNANQVVFADGQTFQAKLDAGMLKGDKGDQGPQGIQGPKGDKGDTGEQGPAGTNGQDGLTTAISVNGNTYTQIDGLITLPNYPNAGTGSTDDNIATDEEVAQMLSEIFGGVK